MDRRLFHGALFVAAIIAYFALTPSRALAVVEYCGATASLTALGASGSDVPASTYALRLSAFSSRVVSGHVAVQTDDGWYDIAFDDVALSMRTHKYRGVSALFTRTDFESPTIYASFSSPVVVRASFVDEATVTGENVLGWDSQPHACAGYAYVANDPRPKDAKDFEALDPDPLPSVPPSDAHVLHAAIASAPGSTKCAVPFARAKATRALSPDFPVGYQIDREFVSLIEVAVDAKGQLDDAWVFAPSGIKAFDDSALRSARMSTYEAGRSFCTDAPGLYLFRAAFRPN